MKPYSLNIKTLNTLHGPVVRFQAVIRPSAKRGIHVRRQKTFRLKTVNPMATMADIQKGVESELDRWATKQLSSVQNGGMKGNP